MREPSVSDDSNDKKRDNDSKLQLLQLAETGADYRQRLRTLTQRTRQIAQAGRGYTFEVTCPWRIRVGGHRGPESILLPAFDALGMPYIPSSTLRGVARRAALQDLKQRSLQKIQQRPDYTPEAAEEEATREAQQEVTRYFGSLEVERSAYRTAKVIFLDAYPLPEAERKSGGLALDMANNVWSWEDDTLNYSPNPNLFFSLKQPTFQIGILPRISGEQGKKICKRVARWLIAGLKAGAGSQINSGYGRLLRLKSQKAVHQLSLPQEFFHVKFIVEGQGIHGIQRLGNPHQPYKRDRETGELKRNRQGQLTLNTNSEAEFRPIAFKSMLRYWFRAFTLGIWDVETVKIWEANLFGGINPKTYGWVKVEAVEIPEEQETDNEQVGILRLAYSPAVPQNYHEAIAKLFENLCWLAFRLGGVGQGARRPCYERKNNPWVRGSSLILEGQNKFGILPSTLQHFQSDFHQRLQQFDKALMELQGDPIDRRLLNSVEDVCADKWAEAVDADCEIWVVSGKNEGSKPYALKKLHEYFHQLEAQNSDDARNLCGGQGGEGNMVPSPIWITDFERYYQVVTVFGATYDPRREYLRRLLDKCQQSFCLFPLSESTQ
jgi:CRISPR-associated protein Cmr6